MRVKFRGAVTYETDESLEQGLSEVKRLIATEAQSLLTTDHIEPLGLHVTVHHKGTASEAQLKHCRTLLKILAESAYSGYVDLWVDDKEPERFHAKEIGRKELTIDDIATT